MSCVSLLFSATLLAFLSSGRCLVENVSPPNGSIIADFEGTLNTTILMCDVVVNGGSLQITTQWNIESFRGSTGLQALPPDEDLFLLTGDELPSDPTFTAHNHLVLLNFTSELDGVTIYCGTGRLPRQANFKLRIYRAPRLMDGLQVTVLEGMAITVDLSEEILPPAFPFPVFQWMRNGVHTVNISGSVVYGYPSVTFFNISRNAAGIYSLFAQNFVINDTGKAVGNDSGGFTIDVLYGPELIEPNSDTFATLQQDNVTLVCGTTLKGNPSPVGQWFSNTNNEISQNNERFSINNGPDTVALTIFDVTQSDGGIWYCLLTLNTPNGTVIQQLQRNLTLTILIPPSEPENTTIESFGPTWITVSWLRPTFQGMPNFTMYRVLAVPTNTTNSNSLAMIPPQPVTVSVSEDVLYANVTELFPGEEYRLSVIAVSEDSGVQARSNLSAMVSALTHTTVPEVLCVMVPRSENGKIRITWDYRHTGGLSLTQVAVEYQQNQIEGFQLLPKDPEFGLELKSFEALNLTAGYTYIFRVIAENENGSTSTECPSVFHMIGIPQVPVILNATSISAGVAVLTVSTREAGVADGDSFEFVIKAMVISDGTSKLFLQEFSDYVDSTVATLSISDLLPDVEYQFNVRIQNVFGLSKFSETTTLRIQALPPRPSSTSTAAIAGGVAASIVILIMVILFVLVIIFILCRKSYASNLEKSKFSSNESDMIDNCLYKTTREKDNDSHQDGSVHYADIPRPSITTSRPQSGVYDTLATPSHTVKQSDNPLYSSTQELRMSTTYDTVPPRARSLTPSSVPYMLPSPNIGSSANHATKGVYTTVENESNANPNIINNKLSYGLELELSNREIPPVHHQRSLSQTANPIYTEL